MKVLQCPDTKKGKERVFSQNTSNLHAITSFRAGYFLGPDCSRTENFYPPEPNLQGECFSLLVFSVSTTYSLICFVFMIFRIKLLHFQIFPHRHFPK